jgi:ketosteroid isomerase-like protein
MSQESVAVVYQTLSAMMNVDHRQAAVNFAPDAEWHNTSAFPGARVCVGPDAILRFWEALVEAFAEGDAEIEQVSEGGDLVVISVHHWGSGRASGAPIDVRYGAIFEVVDQRIVRVDIHGDYATALEVAGLPESRPRSPGRSSAGRGNGGSRRAHARHGKDVRPPRQGSGSDARAD